MTMHVIAAQRTTAAFQKTSFSATLPPRFAATLGGSHHFRCRQRRANHRPAYLLEVGAIRVVYERRRIAKAGCINNQHNNWNTTDGDSTKGPATVWYSSALCKPALYRASGLVLLADVATEHIAGAIELNVV